ncbi:MAG: FtsQ-type POTRA domain-containing protein [Lachnospiraceae bacterium]|nr:FtsQ-type POTRA domain-containing protein [Lachnospiraceae bacterium]
MKTSKRTIVLFIVLLVLILLTTSALFVIKNRFSVDTVNVIGNEHYTDQEIIDLVMTGKYGHNSVYLYLKYHNKEVGSIPFIEQTDIELVSPREVKIQVYEKAVAGYVEYLGHYLYFDKDGIVVESSNRQMEGIPFVTGLHFDHVVLHEKLPVDDEGIFKLVLNITQLLTKYEISTDRIYFDSVDHITLYFGNVRIYLGTSEHLDEKINKLQYLLPKLEGMSGVLHMENYTGETGTFTFEKDE